MRIQNNNYSPNFHAGLTKQIQSEIKHCDVKRITNEFARAGIETDFKNNKTIAWCSYKCAELFQKLKLSLPTAIIVEDFRTINVEEPNASGFNNILPTKLYPNSDKITLQKSIFFNSYSPYDEHLNGKTFWEEIDMMSDLEFEHNSSPTNHFLYHILHEFIHSAHEENIFKTLGIKKALEYYTKTFNPEYLETFQKKYKGTLERICSYATESPNETIACDLGKRISNNLDSSLKINPNFLKETPYKNRTFKEFFMGIEDKNNLDSILRKIWFGKVP